MKQKMVVDSWLIFATECVDIGNTSLRPGIHVDGRSRLARPDQSAGHAKLKSRQPLFLLIIAKNKHCFILYVFVIFGEGARVSRVLPMYVNHVSLA